MRTRKKTSRVVLEALEAASFGFEVLLATKSRQGVMMGQGMEGLRRVVHERRAREMRAWLRAARRARLIKFKRIGDRLMVTLDRKGQVRLLASRIAAAPSLGERERTYVTFDFPISQRRARDTFRRFLKAAGFRMVQQSLWSSNRDAAKPMLALLERTGARKWARVLRGKEEKA